MTKTFLASDLHLDHTNIIKYCKRPFKSLKEMNQTLIRNWNKTVGKEDIVYYLGDFTFSRRDKRIGHFFNKLNGEIVFIQGSHDRAIKRACADRFMLKYKSKEFLLVHDPFEARKGWKGWLIHGHKHNNSLERYPLVNGKRKTINVSIELTDYAPVEIGKLLNRDLDKILYWRTLNESPILS